MKTQRQESIALLFMGELASHYPDRLLSLSWVAKRHGVSLLFLKKIARSLKSAKLITSKEGVNGGYALSANPSSITVWQIFHAIHATPEWETQLTSDPCPLIDTCLPQQINKTITKTLQTSFQNISVSQLIKE